jgi:DNA-binding NarL/FixJ family response regulator
MSGDPMLSPDVIRRVTAFTAEPDPDPRCERSRQLLAHLSDGERAVATLVEGRTNSEIGRELLMSTAAVKAYMARILTKLDLNNRVQVALVVHP